MSAQRRLAAILVGDVVGFSRLVGADEAGTLARLSALRRDVVDPAIARYGGRPFKETGDGFLVEFASAVQAVTCAMEIQKAAGPDSLPLRIGIHVGDVVVQGDDLMGDGVNIAARLEGIAEAGGVCLSDDAHRQVRGKVDIAFDDLGPQTLKNIAQPMQAWRMQMGGAPPALATATPPLSLPDKPSIAVLPFQNMSGDPEQEYFADGMVEDIITALSRFKSLFVIARNSSFTYKGRAVDIKQVARELGVRYVLEGSVRKAGGKVRITSQLIDGQSGIHLWADRFDGALEDVFELQDGITTSVVGAVAPRLDRAEIDRAKRKPITALDAYDCFLRGLAHFNERTRDSIEQARRLFYRAIELDPGFSTPYGMAARCYASRNSAGWVVDKDWEEAETRRLASLVSTVGHDDALALCSAGYALVRIGEDDTGAAMIDRGLSFNQNLAVGWTYRGTVSVFFGQHDAGLEQLTRALRLSPLDPEAFGPEMMMAYAHLCQDRYDVSVEWGSKALVHRPNYLGALQVSAIANALAGNIGDARKIMEQISRLSPEMRISNLDEYLVARRPEDMERLIEGMRLAGLPE